MTQTTIVLNPKRSEYAAEKAAKKSMTVAQMIEALKQFPADARIVVSDHAEYMYAPVTASDLHEHVEEE
jgi:hypothetical protein